jgi:pimeloyl-ACP methyl ester carboxylesterase
MVKRRAVFHIAGYDPIGTAWYRLFKRELVTFTRTWNVRSAVSDLMPGTENVSAQWRVTTHARNWRVETVYEHLLWDDIVLGDFARPTTTRLARSARAFLDIIMSGTALRYFRANWQYGLFFLYPYFLLCTFAVGAVAIAQWAASSIVISYPLQAVLTGVLSVAVFIGLLHWPGRRWRVQQGLDDWTFSWDYVYGRRPDLNVRLERFAETLIARTGDAALDEIVIVGHSMGAILALEVITRALAREPQLGSRGPTVCLVTVGSTIPKFTLHPAGERFRHSAVCIVLEESINWAEYHARSDAISFYKFDPVSLSRFYGDQDRGKPLLRRVRLHHMLKTRTYWRNRLRFMRLHYQFVMANERRANYDYFMMICGPIPFASLVLAQTGPIEFIASDGALIGSATGVQAMPFVSDDDALQSEVSGEDILTDAQFLTKHTSP